CLQGYSTPFTF
nr:immunoglobulin light chain junction region [Macaca mulatta]MOW12916.1 immunoglobulin light chain junction region [Macaca mulatta]MOW42410.1 immunoglobulin light chain junction region [Macaca mulatta]MOW44886.1 immunoglobulin light chain junction region [Macaca mulatta]MOX97141.1 immunoglobulin light chain junction region [Macaca mulatta]